MEITDFHQFVVSAVEKDLEEYLCFATEVKGVDFSLRTRGSNFLVKRHQYGRSMTLTRASTVAGLNKLNF